MWMHSEWSMNDGMNGKQSERKKNDAMHEIECIIRVCNKTGTSTAQAPFTLHILHAPEGIQYAMNCFIAWRWCKNCNLLKFWKRSEKKRENRSTSMRCVHYSKKMKPPYQDVNKKANTLRRRRTKNLYMRHFIMIWSALCALCIR